MRSHFTPGPAQGISALAWVVGYCSARAGVSGALDGRWSWLLLALGLAVAVGPPGTAVAAGKPSRAGHALALDRARHQGLCVTNFGRFAPTHEITIEFWQKVEAQADQAICFLDTVSSHHRIGVFGPSPTGMMEWQFGEGQGAGSLRYWPPEPIVGTWQHFAFVASHRGNYMKVFRNGLEEASRTGMTPFARTNGPLMIGATAWPDGGWGGVLDEVRVWDVARTQAEIQAQLRCGLTGTESNLVACWRFEEGTGVTAADATGRGHTAGLVNGPTWVESAVPPVPGAALSFNGAGQTNQYLAVAGGMELGRAFTIEAWVYERSYQFSSCLMEFGDAGGDGKLVAFLSFEATGMPVLAECHGNGWDGTVPTQCRVWSRKKIPLQTWTHLAFTREVTGLGHIYLDGTRVAAGALDALSAAWRTNIFIGRGHRDLRAEPDVIVEEVRLWNVARTAEEIRREMRFVLTGAESNLVAYWRLDEGAGDTAADASGHGHTASLVHGPQWVAASAPITQGPVAHSLGLSALTARSVTMHGAVCPNGFSTTAWFEWGRDSGYGRATAPASFSNGAAGLALSHAFGDLTPETTYYFRVVCTNVMGRADGEDLKVLTPPVMFLGYRLARWRFAGVLSAAVALLVGGILRHCYLRNFRRKLEHLHQQQALEQERARIARDLHDDLGAAVTQVKLLGELVERDARQPEQTARHAHRIAQTSRELADHLDELVWVVNPRKDHVENLVSYLANFSEELLETANIRCRFDFPDEFPDVPLSGRIRHRLFLAYREALNNIVKHAQATEVRVRLRLTPAELALSVEDDGLGFEVRNPKSEIRNGAGGNGLSNMQARLSEVGGTCLVESRAGAGTKVEMRVKLD